MRKIVDLSAPKREEKKEEEVNPVFEAFVLISFGALFAWFMLAAIVGRINIF